jgi:hypothetical protein
MNFGHDELVKFDPVSDNCAVSNGFGILTGEVFTGALEVLVEDDAIDEFPTAEDDDADVATGVKVVPPPSWASVLTTDTVVDAVGLLLG